MNKDIHAIQGSIIKELLFKQTARFAELNVDKISSDQFTFHIKQLLDQGVMEKSEDGFYSLTLEGKDYANRFDSDSGAEMKIEAQGKLGVLVIATREVDSSREYLMQTRLKHPFFGFRGFITGKVKKGELIADTALRELEEETGLSGTLTHKTIYHERIFSEKKELLEDKCFFLFTIENPTGNIITEFQGGKNEWIKEEAVLEGNIFYDIRDLLALTKEGAPSFSEKDYTVEKY